jgi:hypothetical protein
VTLGRLFRDGDPPVLIGSAVRAQALLGWRPERSALETQIADAWNWMMKDRQGVFQLETQPFARRFAGAGVARI